MLYKNAHNRTSFIFLNIIMFLKIRCANLYAAPISPPLLYSKLNDPFCIIYNFVTYFFIK